MLRPVQFARFGNSACRKRLDLPFMYGPASPATISAEPTAADGYGLVILLLARSPRRGNCRSAISGRAHALPPGPTVSCSGISYTRPCAALGRGPRARFLWSSAIPLFSGRGTGRLKLTAQLAVGLHRADGAKTMRFRVSGLRRLRARSIMFLNRSNRPKHTRGSVHFLLRCLITPYVS
jgi:hypothetical protein